MIEVNHIQQFLSFIQPIVVDAGKYTLAHQRSALIAQQKDEVDFSTDIDVEVEKQLISKIKKKYPSHNIFAEESGGIIDPDQFTWIIDPIDGTKEFFRALTTYCTAVALMYQGELLLSVIYCPANDQLFTAGKGIGAFLNGRKVTVSHKENIGNSFLLFKLPSHRYGVDLKLAYNVLEKLSEESYRVIGPIVQNLGLCEVGMGAYDAFVNIARSGKWWDYASGILFVEEAGGKVITLSGEKYDYTKRKKLYIAGNEKIVDVISSIITASGFHTSL